jgi:hypothetical protein
VLAVDEEAIIAVVRVVFVDETREESDVSILWFGNGHVWWKAVARLDYRRVR